MKRVCLGQVMHGTPSVTSRLAWSSAGCVIALGLALGAAHWYEPPRARGTGGPGIWLEADFLCAAASSALALAVGFSSRRASAGAGAFAARSFVLRGAIWAGLTLAFIAAWVEYLFLFTLLIAPAHAFACLRVLTLWSRWRADRAFARHANS
jgi:hypothetical protein